MRSAFVQATAQALLALSMFVALAPGASAEMVTIDETIEVVVFEDVQFIEGTQGIVTAFDIAAPGNYIARLTDFAFPNPFDEIALSVVTSSASFGSVSGAGEFAFTVTDPGQYFAVIFGVAGGLGEIGLFGIEIAQVVPIPAPVLLFASALAALGLTRRRSADGA